MTALDRAAKILAFLTLTFSALAIVLYEKPGSFYTNFVMLPSLFLWLSACATGLVSAACAVLAKRRGAISTRAALLIGLLTPLFTMAIIALLARV
jgi:hypothetical protein